VLGFFSQLLNDASLGLCPSPSADTMSPVLFRAFRSTSAIRRLMRTRFAFDFGVSPTVSNPLLFVIFCLWAKFNHHFQTMRLHSPLKRPQKLLWGRVLCKCVQATFRRSSCTPRSFRFCVQLSFPFRNLSDSLFPLEVMLAR